MQAITHIAPAIAGFFFTAFIVSLAGITAPLAYFVGFLVVLMLGTTLAQLSRHISVGRRLLHVRQPGAPSPDRLPDAAGCTSCTRR